MSNNVSTQELEKFFKHNDISITVDVMGLNYYHLVLTDYVEPFNRNDSPNRVFISDSIKNQISYYNLNDPHIILDGRGNARYSASLCRNIAFTLGVSKDKITILSSAEPEIELKRKIPDDFHTIVDYAGMCNWQGFYDQLIENNIDWKNISIENHFLTLCNRPSIYRADYTKFILDVSNGKCTTSFGTRENISKYDFEKYKKLMAPYDFPLVIDGMVSRSPLKQHVPPGNKILSNLAQIVQESFEHKEGYVFITEKTFKCFAWHQLPIFVATPGHVAKVRELGFDVFDDIFQGHYYDTETNTHAYKLKTLKLVKHFIETYPSIEDCRKLREKLWDRIVRNNELVNQLVQKNKKPYLIA